MIYPELSAFEFAAAVTGCSFICTLLCLWISDFIVRKLKLTEGGDFLLGVASIIILAATVGTIGIWARHYPYFHGSALWVGLGVVLALALWRLVMGRPGAGK
jgi:hypothetical protein